MEMLGSLKHLFQKPPGNSIGVCGKGGQIFVAYLAYGNGGWQLSSVDELQMSGDAEEAGEMADLVRMHCARNGWSKDHLAVCMPEDRLFLAEVDLPDLEHGKLAEAVHWEIEGKDFFGERAFRTTFIKTGAEDHAYWTASVDEEEAAAWETLWKERGLPLSQLAVLPPPLQDILQWDEERMVLGETILSFGKHISSFEIPSSSLPAIYAALLAAGALRQEFSASFSPGEELDAWNWKRLSLAVACISMLCMSLLAGWDLWQIHAARELQEKTHQERLLLGKEEKKMLLIERSIRETKRRDSKLEDLSRESLPWYSLLVHFGGMTVDGVRISDIALAEKDALNVEGEAVTFDAVAEFLKGFESDKAFFPAGPVLQKTSVPEKRLPGDMVHFSLQLKI